MSQIFIDQHVEVIRMTLNRLDGAGADEFNFSQDYYAAGELYVGSPETFPLLERSPRARRGVGLYFARQFNVDISLHGCTDMDFVSHNLFNLRAVYAFPGSAVTVQYYPKAKDAATTDGTINIRQTLEISQVTHNGPLMQIRCVDKWFDDIELSKELIEPNVSDVEDEYKGEVGQLIFGQGLNDEGVIVDAPLFENEVVSIDGTSFSSTNQTAQAKLFASFAPTDAFFVDSVGTPTHIFAKNQTKQIDDTEWIEIELTTDNVGRSNEDEAGYGAYVDDSLQATSRGLHYEVSAFSPANVGRIITGIECYTNKLGVPTSVTGQLFIELSQSEDLLSTPVPDFVERGSVLRKIPKDPDLPSLAAASVETGFQLESQLVTLPDTKYLSKLIWGNFQDAANTMLSKIEAASAFSSVSRDNTIDIGTWNHVIFTSLAMAIFFMREGADGYDNGSVGSFGYAYQHIQTKPVNLDDLEPRLPINRVEFKLQLPGVLDNFAGSFTGTADAPIERPSDIIVFLLFAPQFLGIPLGQINVPDFIGIRALLDAAGIRQSFSIDRPTKVIPLIKKMCRQGRFIFYKNAQGQFGVNYPIPFTVPDIFIHESRLQGELQVLQLQDLDTRNIINDVKHAYEPDNLRTPKSEEFKRKAGGSKFNKLHLLNETESSENDVVRQSQVVASKALYGVQEFHEDFDFLYDNTAVTSVSNYYFDRFRDRQQKLRFQVPRKRFYDVLDLFNNPQINHHHLPTEGGVLCGDIRGHCDDPVQEIQEKDCDNTATTTVCTGQFRGKILEVEEVGQDIIYTVESMGDFT